MARKSRRRRVAASPEIRATNRLTADGASSYLQIKRRIQWIEQEWLLPRCPKIGRTPSKALCDYVRAHDISWDWLLCGDLKGLQRMIQRRRADKTAASPESLKAKLARLSESEREVVRKLIDRFADGDA
jgi:hypothetical protein